MTEEFDRLARHSADTASGHDPHSDVPLQCGLGLERYCNSVVDLGVIHDMIAV